MAGAPRICIDLMARATPSWVSQVTVTVRPGRSRWSIRRSAPSCHHSVRSSPSLMALTTPLHTIARGVDDPLIAQGQIALAGIGTHFHFRFRVADFGLLLAQRLIQNRKSKMERVAGASQGQSLRPS